MLLQSHNAVTSLELAISAALNGRSEILHYFSWLFILGQLDKVSGFEFFGAENLELVTVDYDGEQGV